MTKKEFNEKYDRAMAVPWDFPIMDVHTVWILPTRRKHESGYAIMHMLIHLKDGRYIKEEGHCDVIDLEGSNFRIDCEYPGKILRIFNHYGFDIGDRLSTVSFIEKRK